MPEPAVGRPAAAGGPVDPRLLRRAPALRRALAGFTAMAAIGSVATVAQASALAAAIAAVLVHHRRLNDVAVPLAVLFAAMVVRAALAGAGEWLGQTTSLAVRSGLRSDLLAAVGRAGGQTLDPEDRGRIAAAASSGIDALDGYLTRAVPAVAAAMVTPPLLLAAIGYTDWLALVLLAVTLPLVPVFMALVGIMTKRHMDRRWEQLARLSGQFLDLLEGLTALKIYGRSRAQVRAVRDGTDSLRRQTLATLRVAFVSGLVLDLLATLSVALVAVTVGLRLDSGKVGLAAALTVLLLAPEVFAPIRAVGAQHHATEEARAVIGTVMGFLDRAGAVAETGAEPFVLSADHSGVVARLRGVEVGYPGRDAPALAGADLDVRAGSLTVLTGRSGAGKTTVLSVLLGRVQPAGGSVTVGAADRDRPAADAWLANVAWLPQRPRLTSADVAAEVRLGDPDLGDADLRAILARCATPDATTALGEDGRSVSAGQRRRVALARALARAERVIRLGGVPLVLLDEPTEDLDPETSGVVLSVIADLAGRAAVVAATHDPALTDLADVEVEVTGGRLAGRPGRGARGGPRTRVGLGVPAGLGGPAALGLPGGPAVAARVEAPLGAQPAPGPADRRRGLISQWVWSAVRSAPGARRALVLASGLGSLAGLSGLALTATSVWLICRASQHPNVQALAVAVVGVRTFALSKAFLRYGERLAAHDGALRLLSGLRVRVFSALEPLAPAGLGSFRRGDLLRRFTSDVDGGQEALVRAFVPLAGAAATAAGSVILCAALAPPAAVALAAGVLAGGALLPAAVRRASGDSSPAATLAGYRDAMANGLVDGLDELTAYGAVAARRADIAAADRRVTAALRRPIRAAAAGTAASGIVSAATITAVLVAGTTAVTGGRLDAVDLGVLAATALVAFDALGALPAAFAALGRCVAGLGRVEEVINRPVPVAPPAIPAPAPALIRGINGARLVVAPGIGAAPVLRGANLRLRAGETLAVVGPSGSGKSTLLTAVLGLLSPLSGQVHVTGEEVSVPVTEISGEARPALIAGSLQGDHVFSTTLRDNLRVVAPGATDHDLDEVARRAGLGEFVASLPDGWSTQAGPDGANLSGGQRQRLLLARALLADPQVLVLDEPTAHLDPQTEEAVMADLFDATAGRTVLMSTHRAAPLSRCDHVTGLSGGRLVEQTAPPEYGVGAAAAAALGTAGA